jgi:hypothetical protein
MILLDALQIFSGCKEPEYQGVVMSSKRRLFHKKKVAKEDFRVARAWGYSTTTTKITVLRISSMGT